MMSSFNQDGGPRLLFLNQTSKCYSRRKSVAERKLINIHVQQNQHRRQRQAAIQRLQDGRWHFYGPAFQVKTVKTPPGFHQAATDLKDDLEVPSNNEKGVVKIEEIDGEMNSSDDYPLSAHFESIVSRNKGKMQKWSHHRGSGTNWDQEPESFSSSLSRRPGSISSFLDTAELDPFGNSVLPISKTMNFILSHFVKVIIPLVYPINLQATSANQQILQIAFENPVAMNSMLAVSSVQQQAPSRSLPMSVHARNPDHLLYKINAINMINIAMSDPTEASKASTIMAINNLMTIETMIGNDAEVQIHINGIERILATRGGFEGLPIVIVELLLPCLYMSSAWTHTKPVFPPPKPPYHISTRTASLITSSLPPILNSLFTGFSLPTLRILFSPRMRATIVALETFTLFREHFRTSARDLLLPELQHITIQGLHVEYQLLVLPFNEPQHPIQEAVRNALLMFKNSLYGIHSPTATIYRALLSRMKAALDVSDLANYWAPTPELLLWILCMGAHHSGGEVERPWFVMQIARGVQLLRLSSWEDLEAILRCFCYFDRIYGKSMRRIWAEVELLTMTSNMGGA
jgi:hypothetical protein